MRTFTPKTADITRDWHLVDADGLVLGRMCTEVARILRGKHKPIFSTHVDTGDHVVIVNASKVVLTRGKAETELVHDYSGYPGGLRTQTYGNLLKRKPEDAIQRLPGRSAHADVRQLAEAQAGGCDSAVTRAVCARRRTATC